MPRITGIEDLVFPVELHPVYTNIEIDGKQLQKNIPNSRVVVLIKNQVSPLALLVTIINSSHS